MTGRALKPETIFIETAQYSIHRIETAQLGSVIVKASRSPQPSRKDISQLENEYSILKSIEDVEGVPRAIGLEIESHKALLILEDFGGVSLREFQQGRALRLDQFFTIAKQITAIIGSLHARNIVHCDLKPQNVLINPTTMAVQIIDFGCSRQIVGRGPFQSDGQGMTLAYIAPEQTGRVNRRIDHRTDFYSLGISFYELLAGKLPFRAGDALEWAHAHIAKKARPLHEVDHHITPALSQIVERLMKKAPEERYQTPEGLLHDLRAAEALFLEHKLWESIVVGERDRSNRILLAQGLVGRERELAVLKDHYALSASEGISSVIIQGEAGVGKSALAREFRRLYADQLTLFGFGKADSRRGAFPFSSFATVTEDLVRQIGMAPEHLRSQFASKVEQRLQKGLGALVVIAPSLANLAQVTNPSEDALDNIEQLYLAIATLFETMAAIFGQVVVQLDDAHFIDESSAKAGAWLIENMSPLKLLIVLNYRASELQSDGALNLIIKATERLGTQGAHLTLNDLKLEDVALFLKETLQDSNDTFTTSSQELTDLLFRKSGGNPLFMGQVLKTWIDDQLLFRDPDLGWTWNKHAIEAKEIAKTVLDLFGSKIHSLPANIRHLFTMASCFSKTFSLADLAELTCLKQASVRRSVSAVIEAGLLISESDSLFRFAHEQIREAFYSFLSPEGRRDLHANIGLKLLGHVDFETASSDDLYLMAEHLNLGLDQILDDSARLRVADLNLRVSQMARDALAYELGLAFAVAGLKAGDALTWEDPQRRLFQLYSLKGECESLGGNFVQAQATFKSLRKSASSRNDQIRASLHLFRLLHTRGRTLDAMTEGLDSLAFFGMEIDRRPSKLSLMIGLVRAAYDLRGDQVQRIPILEGHSEDVQFIRLRQELAVVTSTAAYFIDKQILLSLGLTGYRMALKEGLSGESCNHFLLVGMVIAGKVGRYQQVEKNCAGTIDRLLQSLRPRASLLMRFNRQAFVLPWLTHWSSAVTKLEEIQVQATQLSAPFTLALASLYIPYYKMYLGHEIDETEHSRAQRSYLASNDSMLYDCALPGYGFRALLRGETKSETDFSHEGFDEAEYITRVSKSSTPNPKAWFDAHKMMALFMFGYYQQAAEKFSGARLYLALTPFSITNVLIRVFGIMVICENARAGRPPSLLIKWRIARVRANIRHWAKLNPVDVEPYWFLAEAELAAVKGRQLEAMTLFEKAAQAALKTKSWMIAGIIYERTARFNIFYRRERLARAHAEEASYCFERWGATAKVAQVQKLYGLTAARQSISSDSHVSSSSDSRKLSAQIDLESMMKSTRALSSELDINVLSVKLTEVMMESAGASLALLLMPSPTGLVIQSAAGESREGYPELVSECVRSAETILIADSSRHELTSRDPYFKSQSPMSALCIPIFQKGTVSALVYLENESATNVFTDQQLEVLKIILSQAGIALENARLYGDVSEKARMAGELKTAQTVQRTLFPTPQLKLSDVTVTGFYEPASECGGDWWFHHEHGDKLFIYIGDATGHGASAALATSAARSAVSLLSLDINLTPQYAMSRLNHAIFETSKGSMNMTFFIGSYDRKTGQFDYCNASHEPPFWIKTSVTEAMKVDSGQKSEAQLFQEFKSGLASLDDVHGPRLGESVNSEYRQSQVDLKTDDLIVLFTDGVQDARNEQHQEWGQRRFLKALCNATTYSHDVDDLVQQVVAENKTFTGSTPLDDDIMVIACKGLRR